MRNQVQDGGGVGAVRRSLWVFTVHLLLCVGPLALVGGCGGDTSSPPGAVVAQGEAGTDTGGTGSEPGTGSGYPVSCPASGTCCTCTPGYGGTCNCVGGESFVGCPEAAEQGQACDGGLTSCLGCVQTSTAYCWCEVKSQQWLCTTGQEACTGGTY